MKNDSKMQSRVYRLWLERRANELLGEKPLDDSWYGRIECEVFDPTGKRKLYVPKAIWMGTLPYQFPVSRDALVTHGSNYDGWCRCADCGKPRSYGSGQLCRACYRNRAHQKYLEKAEIHLYWGQLHEMRAWDWDERFGPLRITSTVVDYDALCDAA